MKTIREAREETGRSMIKAANTLGISYNTWQAWERQINKPPEYIYKLLLEELELLSKGQFSDEVSEMSLKELRLSMGINRKDVTNIIGVPISTLTLWENGRQSPPEYVMNLVKRGLVRAYNRTH